MLIKTNEKKTAGKRLVEHYTLEEANIVDEFTRLGKARATAEMTMESLR